MRRWLPIVALIGSVRSQSILGPGAVRPGRQPPLTTALRRGRRRDRTMIGERGAQGA